MIALRPTPNLPAQRRSGEPPTDRSWNCSSQAGHCTSLRRRQLAPVQPRLKRLSINNRNSFERPSLARDPRDHRRSARHSSSRAHSDSNDRRPALRPPAAFRTQRRSLGSRRGGTGPRLEMHSGDRRESGRRRTITRPRSLWPRQEPPHRSPGREEMRGPVTAGLVAVVDLRVSGRDRVVRGLGDVVGRRRNPIGDP